MPQGMSELNTLISILQSVLSVKIISKNHLPGRAYLPEEFTKDVTDRDGNMYPSRRFGFFPDGTMLRALNALDRQGIPLFYAATYADIRIEKVKRPSNLPTEFNALSA